MFNGTDSVWRDKDWNKFEKVIRKHTRRYTLSRGRNEGVQGGTFGKLRVNLNGLEKFIDVID